MRTLLLLALSASTVVAQQTARVNDPVTPGTLGDNSLSLDEAIRVVNGSLMLGQLSAAEQAQISGPAPTIIEIDAAVTPTISISQPPTPLDGPTLGVDVALRGINGRPILDATGQTHALEIRTNEADVSNLAFHNGADGIRADASVHFQPSRKVTFDQLDFTGQSGRGVHLAQAAVPQTTLGTLSNSTFRNLATAVSIEDHSQGGAIRLDVEFVEFDGVKLAADMFVDASGSMTLCRMWRCHMPDGERVATVRRNPTSDQRAMLMLVASQFATTEDSVSAVGTPLVESAVHVHHSVFKPATGKRAFVMGPSDSRIDFHISENVIYGDIVVEEGRLNRRLWAWNNVFRDGTFSVTNLGTPPSFRWNRFERCTISTTSANTAQMKHASTEFESCTIDGQSFTGDILLENCWLNSTNQVGNVNSQSPAPSPWLALTDASTDQPILGGYVDLTLDLPSGMIGVWELGLSNPRLVLTQEPWRDYAFKTVNIQLPGFYALRSTVRIPVPNDQNLVGIEVYCTATTAPYLGQGHVPAFNLPRGAHLTIKN